MIPVEPIHPGEYVRDELEERNLTQDNLAALIGPTEKNREFKHGLETAAGVREPS